MAYFRSDNAPEFPQPSDLAEFGIWRETIAAYLPELNGLAEVVNKLILQQIYRIVVTLGPQILKLIYYVIQYSITMINHTPRRSLKGQTPYGCYYQLSEGNFYRFPFAIDCVVTFSNAIEKNRYGVTSTKGAPSSIMGAVIGYASDCFSYYVLLKICGVILSLALMSVYCEAMRLLTPISKTYPLHLCHTLFLWLKVSREGNWALSTRYAEHMWKVNMTIQMT